MTMDFFCSRTLEDDGRREQSMPERLADIESAGHRLALELECLLLDTKYLPIQSRWWSTALDAVSEWQKLFPYNGPRLGD
jgi:hypothetical protein